MEYSGKSSVGKPPRGPFFSSHSNPPGTAAIEWLHSLARPSPAVLFAFNHLSSPPYSSGLLPSNLQVLTVPCACECPHSLRALDSIVVEKRGKPTLPL
jgi:hypothetical protein